MPLPVLTHAPAATHQDLVRLFHQSDLDWCRHLGDETTLDGGTWISNRALPGVPEANCFANAKLLPGTTARQMFDQVQSRSATEGAPICRWTLNPSAPLEQTALLAKYLEEIGWSKSVEDILLLRHRRALEVAPTDLTVIPARASFPMYRRLIEQIEPIGNSYAVDAHMLHLDDSHFEPMLAIRDKEPIASMGVLVSGEIGTLRHVFVTAGCRRRGVGRFMLGRVLDFCGRAGLRWVMVTVANETPAAKLFSVAGFEKMGEWVHYTRPGSFAEYCNHRSVTMQKSAV